MPKIVKLSSSTEKAKLETLYSRNKGSPKVIKSHEDNENNKRKSSSKMFFWGSPDLYPGIETLLRAMNLCENSKSLIISINLCNIKNLIHLSNLERLTGFKFPQRNYQGLMVRKVIFESNKKNHRLHEDDVFTEHMIPTTFNEDTKFLSDIITNSLKRR
jgi:hypothetical protein